ncbi:hypothetical protein TcasGA2_TC032632 [Tribolium castaneum]|uniref:Uncharacterized protein n=1 Tax=Tribolium castaneum TaxID=7070 RepID=A0A139W9J7_TRICA|nr:hypothetical protein TcasGA2_TC032632 [Tribolium castaneum]
MHQQIYFDITCIRQVVLIIKTTIAQDMGRSRHVRVLALGLCDGPWTDRSTKLTVITDD